MELEHRGFSLGGSIRLEGMMTGQMIGNLIAGNPWADLRNKLLFAVGTLNLNNNSRHGPCSKRLVF
jgi:hypothetical protein